jgi:hypothetical protein
VKRRAWPPAKIREACEAEAVLPLELVGEMLGKGKTAVHAWANRPDCPVRVDRTARPFIVPSADLLRYLGLDAEPQEEARPRAVP